MKVEDPALFLFAFFDRHLPGHVEHDPREVFCELMRRAQDVYKLDRSDPACRVQDVERLNLLEIARADQGFIRWISLQGIGADGETHQALGYTFGDTLVFHGLASRGDTSYDFINAWRDLSGGLFTALRGCNWTSAGDALWGLNCCYSVLLPDEEYQNLAPGDIHPLLSRTSDTTPLMARTKLGQLWRVGNEWLELPDVADELKATWVMVSPRSAEKELQTLLHDITGPIPPAAPLLFQARHKFFVQLAQYERAESALRRAQESLDKRLSWMIEAQRDYEELSQIVGAEEAEELRQKTSRAHTNMAAFEQAVTRVNELRTTLAINLRNYRERSTALLTSEAEDEVFRAEQGYMERRSEQIGYDCSYFAAVLGRARSTLEAAQAQFNISQERQQGDAVRLGVMQVSAVAASLMALVVTQVLSLSDLPQERPVLVANLILLALVGTFAVAQLLLAWGRIRAAITRLALAGAVGFVTTTLLSLLSSRALEIWYGPVAAGVFLLTSGGVYSLVRFLEEAPRRRLQPAWRRMRGFTSAIEKLRLASEEMADLLDDLPPTQLYRLKEDASFREKIHRKNRGRADELGVTFEKPGERGLTYTERDIGDAIGIRYVVSPWELPTLVERIERVLGRRMEGIEYKKGKYKSVHIGVDLWGIGAKHDLNLMAEIQVRTFLQDFYASKVHDTIYQDEAEGGMWLLRALKRGRVKQWVLPLWDRLLAIPSDIELFLFRRWMRWG